MKQDGRKNNGGNNSVAGFQPRAKNTKKKT